jgi:hypothetical protein
MELGTLVDRPGRMGHADLRGVGVSFDRLDEMVAAQRDERELGANAH